MFVEIIAKLNTLIVAFKIYMFNFFETLINGLYNPISK
ncbi:hypothetical protein FHW89_003707 [Mucilaginibacter sp. SG564]|nr:hypothetical protein [Mucilaginibacter sp. SG564]